MMFSDDQDETKQKTFAVEVNTLRPRQNGRHFRDDPFKRISFIKTVRISINILLQFVT